MRANYAIFASLFLCSLVFAEHKNADVAEETPVEAGAESKAPKKAAEKPPDEPVANSTPQKPATKEDRPDALKKLGFTDVEEPQKIFDLLEALDGDAAPSVIPFMMRAMPKDDAAKLAKMSTEDLQKQFGLSKKVADLMSEGIKEFLEPKKPETPDPVADARGDTDEEKQARAREPYKSNASFWARDVKDAPQTAKDLSQIDLKKFNEKDLHAIYMTWVTKLGQLKEKTPSEFDIFTHDKTFPDGKNEFVDAMRGMAKIAAHLTRIQRSESSKQGTRGMVLFPGLLGEMEGGFQTMTGKPDSHLTKIWNWELSKALVGLADKSLTNADVLRRFADYFGGDKNKKGGWFYAPGSEEEPRIAGSGQIRDTARANGLTLQALGLLYSYTALRDSLKDSTDAKDKLSLATLEKNLARTMELWRQQALIDDMVKGRPQREPYNQDTMWFKNYGIELLRAMEKTPDLAKVLPKDMGDVAGLRKVFEGSLIKDMRTFMPDPNKQWGTGGSALHTHSVMTFLTTLADAGEEGKALGRQAIARWDRTKYIDGLKAGYYPHGQLPINATERESSARVMPAYLLRYQLDPTEENAGKLKTALGNFFTHEGALMQNVYRNGAHGGDTHGIAPYYLHATIPSVQRGIEVLEARYTGKKGAEAELGQVVMMRNWGAQLARANWVEDEKKVAGPYALLRDLGYPLVPGTVAKTLLHNRDMPNEIGGTLAKGTKAFNEGDTPKYVDLKNPPQRSSDPPRFASGIIPLPPGYRPPPDGRGGPFGPPGPPGGGGGGGNGGGGDGGNGAGGGLAGPDSANPGKGNPGKGPDQNKVAPPGDPKNPNQGKTFAHQGSNPSSANASNDNSASASGAKSAGGKSGGGGGSGGGSGGGGGGGSGGGGGGGVSLAGAIPLIIPPMGDPVVMPEALIKALLGGRSYSAPAEKKEEKAESSSTKRLTLGEQIARQTQQAPPQRAPAALRTNQVGTKLRTTLTH